MPMRWLGVVAAVVLLAGCSSRPAEVVETATPEPAPTVASNLPTQFPGNGSFVGGVDVAPGVYLEETPSGQCEWLLGKDGNLIGSGSGDVVVGAGVTVEVKGCSVFVLAVAA